MAAGMASGVTTGIEQTGQIIQVSIAPVFLLAAIATLLIVLTNRLARVVDRSRALTEGGLASSRRDASHEIAIHARRVLLINRAIELCTASALLISLVIIALFVGALVAVPLFPLIATLFILAMLSLIAALLCFLREVFLAVSALATVDGGSRT